MLGFGRKGHGKRHDVGSSKDHKGDIYNALVGAVNALTGANVAVDTQTLNDAISAAIVGMDWQSTIIRFEAMVTNEPVAPSDGDRFISTEAGTIPSTTQAVLVDDVCQWDAGTSLWIVTTPDDGWAVQETTPDPNIAWWYSGAAWRKIGTMVDHSNLLNLNWSVAGHIMNVALDMNTHQINNVVDPTLAQDVVTKNYVDVTHSGLPNAHHNKLHDIDAVLDHNGVTGAVINELMKFNTNGLPAVSNLNHVFVSRAVPETGSDYIEIGKFTQTQGSFAIMVAVSSIDSAPSLSGSDLYYIVGNYDETAAAWQLAYPIQTIEPHSQLCVMIDDDELHLRLIAISSTINPVTVKVQILDMGVGNAVFTAASGTGSMGLPATTFPSTLISQVAGGIHMHGGLSMNSEKIFDVVDPTAAQGVATKHYHDLGPKVIQDSEEGIDSTSSTTPQLAFQSVQTLETAKYIVMMQAEFQGQGLGANRIVGSLEYDDGGGNVPLATINITINTYCVRTTFFFLEATAGSYDFDFFFSRGGAGIASVNIRRKRLTIFKVVE